MDKPQRTLSQNAALHLWLRQTADLLNDAGMDMKKTLKESVDIPWTEESAKLHLWKPVMEAMTGNDSTTEMDTVEPSEICKVITKHIGENHGVVLTEWPNRFTRDE